MSVVNIIHEPDALYLFTDAAGILNTGELREIKQKVHILAHCNAAISGRGLSSFVEGMIPYLNRNCCDFEHLLEEVPRYFRSEHTRRRLDFEACSTGSDAEIYICGYSTARDRLESYGIASHGDYSAPWAFTLLGNVTFVPGMPPVDTAGCSTMEEIGIRIMDRQRELMRAEERGLFCSGGFVQMTSVKRTEISTKIIKRYDDKIGDII